MKRLLLEIIAVVSFLSLLVVPAIAASDGVFGLKKTADSIGGYDTSGNETIFTIISKGVSAFLAMLGIIFLGVCLYAGLRWMTARGKDEYATKAKVALEAGVIGLIIVLTAYAATRLLFSQFGP